MTRILSLLCLILAVSGCSQKFESDEINSNFTEVEIRDLFKLKDFFQNQMCKDKDAFKSCVDTMVPNLVEFGRQPILDRIDFEGQKCMYLNLESDLFLQIWNFCELRNLKKNKAYKSLCLNNDGKYVQFLRDLSERNSDLKEYYESIIANGDWESMGLLQDRMFNHPENYDLNDSSIQVLITIHFLTQNDQQKRKDPWTEN